MKKIVFSLCAVGLLGACQQMCQMHAVPLKECVASKTIAFPSTPVTAPVADASQLAYGVWGAAMLNSGSNLNTFINSLKDELRRRGWKIVVAGITGRGGERNSVNSGAAFTVVGLETANSTNLSVVENVTGQEVLLIRGCSMWGLEEKAKDAADALERLVK